MEFLIIVKLFFLQSRIELISLERERIDGQSVLEEALVSLFAIVLVAFFILLYDGVAMFPMNRGKAKDPRILDPDLADNLSDEEVESLLVETLSHHLEGQILDSVLIRLRI